MFLASDGKPLPFPKAVVSGRATGVPGAVAMLARVHREHGRLAWRTLFDDAGRTAAAGFTVSPRLARFLASNGLPQLSQPDSRRYFARPGGGLLKAGDLLRNPAYAAFLKRLAAQGPRALYAGADRFEAASARPDFAVLLFPVVTLRKPYDTTRTRREIVGEKATAEVEAAWSLDTYASKDAPPTIIFAAADDATTPPGHGILLFETLVAAGASAELHLFRDGGHGWGLGKPGQVISQWPALFETWARSLQIIEKQGE
jgi:pimeloyl-ACP methyl ester carboxylesterase